MPKSKSIMIHKFDSSTEPSFDDDGDQREGCYYQFVGADNEPLGSLVGPYRDNLLAERAAHRAYLRRDYI